MKKFLFISNANENIKTNERWKGWSESREKIIKILENEKFKTKIHLVTMDFSSTENHSSTFPIGAFYGLKAYIDYQFKTGKNIINYYDRLANKKLISLNPENTNMFAYECFWDNKPAEALKVINWAISKFPNENNLYDSQGEFYEKLGNLNSAKISFQNAIDVLSKKKQEMDIKAYNETMEFYKGNIQRVSK
jgi:tetratricopeptide (TPR) repeat protein